MRRQQCTSIFHVLCDLQEYGTFDRTRAMVFYLHI
jgi:hypothetical protein